MDFLPDQASFLLLLLPPPDSRIRGCFKRIVTRRCSSSWRIGGGERKNKHWRQKDSRETRYVIKTCHLVKLFSLHLRRNSTRLRRRELWVLGLSLLFLSFALQLLRWYYFIKLLILSSSCKIQVLSGAFICRWLANRGCLLFLRRGVKLLLTLDANKTDALHELN